MNIRKLLARYKYRFLFTSALILLEAALLILFPLFIGFAIDDAISDELSGAMYLGLLGVSVLIVGVGRRVFDSRFYATVYQDIGSDLITKLEGKETSVKTARLNMLKELIEFLEDSLPELINNVIAVLGVVAILATLNLNVFYGSLVVSVLIFLIYWFTGNTTIRYNERANNELERQVDVIAQNSKTMLRTHLKEMMRWTIKLSDLEAMNFSLSWLVALAFLVVSIVIAIGDGILQYGALFALVMYVFQYIEAVIMLPLYYQNWLRLKEIILRLKLA